MTNKKLIEKLKVDIDMRVFSHHTKDNYVRKVNEIVNTWTC